MGLTKFTEKLISDSFKASISGSDTTESSSFASRVTLVEGGTTSKTLVSGSAQLAADISGSFGNQRVGTSDSPTFAGGTITGDFAVGGTLTAQEIHTEFESASILFTSGSTIFGNSSDDVHNMTGSLNVSGSLFVKDGTLTVTDNVDFNGDLDVDGTTNLDVVDIDGAVDMASTLTVGTDLTVTGQDIQTGASNWLHLGDDSRIVSIGQGNELNFLYDTNSDAAIYVNYNGYNGSNGQFRDFAIANGKGSVVMTVDGSASAVGIGTSTPKETFEVAGHIANWRLYSTSGVSNGALSFNSYYNGSAWVHDDNSKVSMNMYLSDSRDNLEFSVRAGDASAGAGSTQMVISSAGRVGIGTDSPESQLTFSTQAYTTSADNGIRIQNPDTTADAVIQHYENSDYVDWYIGANAYVNTSGGQVRYNTSKGTAAINISAANGHIFFATSGTGANPTSRMLINNTGAITQPSQPAFCVILADDANKGTGSEYQLTITSERFDQGSNFASNQFTAPVTGKYQLNLVLRLLQVPANADYITVQIKTSNDNYSQVIEPTTDKDFESLCLSVLADMDANDTAHVTFYQGGGSGTTDIDSESFFSGYLVA